MTDADSDGSIEAGGDLDRVNVTLRVAADGLDPAIVSGLLGVVPSQAAKKGERTTRGGNARVQRTGVWLLELPTSTEWLVEDAINTLLDRLPGDVEIWSQLRALGNVEVLLGLHLEAWNRGFGIGAATFKRLAELGIGLDFDIYADEDA